MRDDDARAPRALPRRGAAPAALLALLALAVTAWAAADGGARPDHPLLPVLAAALRALAAGAAAALLRARARRGDGEQDVWRRFAAVPVAVALTALADVGTAAARAAGHAPAPDVLAVVASLGALTAAGVLYQAFIVWNRVSTRTADPGDWLNGLGAALAVTAAADLALRAAAPAWAGGWHPAVLQLWVLQGAALLVALGALGAVAGLAGLGRDRRLWALAAALPLPLALPAAAGDGPHDALRETAGAGWLLVVLVLLGCAAARHHPVRARPAGNAALTVGSFVAQVAAVAVLAAATRQDPAVTRWATGLALAAFACGAARVVHLVRDLDHLARTRHEALTDDLTGLPNRRAFSRRLEEACRPGRGGGLTVLLLDLDRFKEVNDRFGHAAGDELLQSVATALGAAVPAGGLLARLGGDEFAVLLDGAGEEEAHGVARRLVRAGEVAGRLEGRPLRVGASVGAASARRGDLPGGELLRRADTAMYAAKAAGGGVRAYDDDADRLARDRGQLAEDLQHLLTAPGRAPGEELEVHYQPQVDLCTGAVTGAEALLRWRHPERGLLPPAAFLDLLEERGLVARATEFVLRETAASALRWRRAGHDVRLSVNLSASCLGRPELVALLDELVAGGLDPARTVLEVTETVLMSDPGAALATCEALTARGFCLSIDDYGTGYSSLSYLGDLPARELKIDRSFTARAAADPRVRAIVAGTVALGHQLGMRVVAEGVEDEATLDLVRRLGCDESQGYLHGRPGPAAELLARLRAERAVRRERAGV
ncbi:putative bifunctional diguanylate cyclase/phosphodiesterase [Kineococcus terrestris]|uniref:putative bifunctional diguanylate cyclase/phosphodiesterase n=1 Tax=Kineococcus terrestris TaxID=2044856 RepID=UPI0034DB0A93